MKLNWSNMIDWDALNCTPAQRVRGKELTERMTKAANAAEFNAAANEAANLLRAIHAAADQVPPPRPEPSRPRWDGFTAKDAERTSRGPFHYGWDSVRDDFGSRAMHTEAAGDAERYAHIKLDKSPSERLRDKVQEILRTQLEASQRLSQPPPPPLPRPPLHMEPTVPEPEPDPLAKANELVRRLQHDLLATENQLSQVRGELSRVRLEKIRAETLLVTESSRVRSLTSELQTLRAAVQAAGGLGGSGPGLRLPATVTVVDLLHLCHPDRHSGSAHEKRAGAVTTWLLAERERLKRA